MRGSLRQTPGLLVERADCPGLHGIGAGGVRDHGIKKAGIGCIDGVSSDVGGAAEVGRKDELVRAVFDDGLRIGPGSEGTC